MIDERREAGYMHEGRKNTRLSNGDLHRDAGVTKFELMRIMHRVVVVEMQTISQPLGWVSYILEAIRIERFPLT